MDVILFAMLLGEIETLDDDVVPYEDDTVDAKDIVTRENLEITTRVDASDAIATNQEIKAEDDVLESEDGNNLLDLINRVDALENAVDLELEDLKVSRHNKPKKVHFKEVQPQDYTCDEEDESIIKSIGGCREEHVVVRVDDIFINFETFKCLLRRNAYVNGYVINAYINLIRAEKHLLCMAKSTIYLGNTLIVGLLQRDGKNKEKIKPNIKEDSIVERVMKYVAHDLVFLPINIEEMHWYLAVVNPKRCEIHVLGSLGPMSRDDLGHVLDGLKLQIDAALGVRDITDHKWPDLQVSLWPVVEQFYHRMQTDGVSCGKYYEKFAVYILAIIYTTVKSDMRNFRLKLAATLCDSTLNTTKELPDDGITDDYTFDTIEFVIENKTQLSQLMCIRKEWVPSSDPYPISLSLKNLQDILDVSRSMDVDVFNLAVRMLACDMAMVLREPKSHFMELTFSIIHHNPAYNHPSYYYLPRIQKIAKTYDRAMDEIDPSWNDDIYDWNHIYLCLVPKTFDR
uniref:Ubiquitin-like protease family profile domain-containing protein n=1 Tax=Setaria italica TaxID=4555 RepID=K3YCB5_SETIT